MASLKTYNRFNMQLGIIANIVVSQVIANYLGGDGDQVKANDFAPVEKFDVLESIRTAISEGVFQCEHSIDWGRIKGLNIKRICLEVEPTYAGQEQLDLDGAEDEVNKSPQIEFSAGRGLYRCAIRLDTEGIWILDVDRLTKCEYFTEENPLFICSRSILRDQPFDSEEEAMDHFMSMMLNRDEVENENRIDLISIDGRMHWAQWMIDGEGFICGFEVVRAPQDGLPEETAWTCEADVSDPSRAYDAWEGWLDAHFPKELTQRFILTPDGEVEVIRLAGPIVAHHEFDLTTEDTGLSFPISLNVTFQERPEGMTAVIVAQYCPDGETLTTEDTSVRPGKSTTLAAAKKLAKQFVKDLGLGGSE
jgi:hypothetical protein